MVMWKDLVSEKGKEKSSKPPEEAREEDWSWRPNSSPRQRGGLVYSLGSHGGH